MEIFLRLRRDLTVNPARSLVRTRRPFDGMSYFFSMIDPSDRLAEYHFRFQVQYSQDEEAVVVIQAAFSRFQGM